MMGNETTETPCNVTNHSYPKGFAYFEVMLIVLISLSSIVGNGLVLIAFVKLRRLRTSINVFILNLAVADITFGLILPGIVPNLLYQESYLQEGLCASWGFASGICVLTTMYTLTAIAASRHHLVVYSMRYMRVFTFKVNLIVSACLWIIAFLMMTPTLAGVLASKDSSNDQSITKIDYNKRTGACSYSRLPEHTGYFDVYIIFVLGCLLPLTLIIGFYSSIFLVVYRSRHRAATSKNDAVTTNTNTTSSSNASGRGTARAGNNKLCDVMTESTYRNEADDSRRKAVTTKVVRSAADDESELGEEGIDMVAIEMDNNLVCKENATAAEDMKDIVPEEKYCEELIPFVDETNAVPIPVDMDMALLPVDCETISDIPPKTTNRRDNATVCNSQMSTKSSTDLTTSNNTPLAPKPVNNEEMFYPSALRNRMISTDYGEETGPEFCAKNSEDEDETECAINDDMDALIAEGNIALVAIVPPAAGTNATPAVTPTGRHVENDEGCRLTVVRTNSSRDGRELALTRMMVAIFLGFVVCFGPFFFVNIIDNQDERCSTKGTKIPDWLHKVSAWLLYFHACINPVIYGIMNTQFRQDYRTIFKRRRHSLGFTMAGASSVGGRQRATTAS